MLKSARARPNLLNKLASIFFQDSDDNKAQETPINPAANINNFIWTPVPNVVRLAEERAWLRLKAPILSSKMLPAYGMLPWLAIPQKMIKRLRYIVDAVNSNTSLGLKLISKFLCLI